MNKQATDVDRALAAIGGVQMNYRTFGPLPIPKTPPELAEIFVYNDAGIGEYHPPAAPEPAPDMSPPIQLAGLPETLAIAPDAEGAPVEAPAASEPPVVAATFAPVPPVVAAPAPYRAPQTSPADMGLPELWRERHTAASETSAIGAEARSLAAMFNMLAGKTHGGVAAAPDSGKAVEPAPRDDRSDLFRRL